MDDKKLPLAVGGGTAALVLIAAISTLSGDDTPALPEPVAAVEEVAAPAEESAQAEPEATEVAEDAAQAVETSDEQVAEAPSKDAGDASLAAPLVAGDPGAMDFSSLTPEQSAAFGAQVRAYLLSNPQVIMEAVAVLEQREAEQQAMNDVNLIAQNADAIFEDGFSWVGGNPEGDVTVVEFLDYRCGYCRRAHPEVEELIASDGNIRLIVKEFPILGDASTMSSRFAIATRLVAGDDAYKTVHDALIALEGAPTEPTLSRMASTLGLDVDAIFEAMESDEVTQQIAETRALAQALQINGTPSFVFGDQMVRGYVPLEGMQNIVSQIRGDG